jgi:hypothetical protein
VAARDQRGAVARENLEGLGAKTGRIGWYFYFDPATRQVGEKLGLGPFEFYLLGRGGVLGNVSAAIVSAAFGYFNPKQIEETWNHNCAVVSPAVAAQSYFDECGHRGSERLHDVAGLDAYINAADIVINHANTAGMPLFAGYKQPEWADDPAGRAMQKATVLRELRGGFHLFAVLASGLTPVQAHAMKNPGHMHGFGWNETPDLPADSAERLQRAEELTNQVMTPAFDTLTDQQFADLVAGTNAIDAALPLAVVDLTPDKMPLFAQGIARATAAQGIAPRAPLTGIGVSARAGQDFMVEVEATAVLA